MCIIQTSSRTHRAQLAIIMGSLSALGALTIDMYLPALPGMADDLSTSAALVQLTLTTFVVGLAVGQVMLGPLSDAWGRRRPLLVGLVIYLAASLGCVFAPSVEWLIGARILQSLGAAAGTVLARAMVRDIFTGTAMTRFFSTLMLVNGVAPVVAPVIGGQLLIVGPWRLVFVVLAVLGAILLLLVAAALPESLPVERRQPAHLRTAVRNFATLLTDRTYLRYVLAAALLFAAMFTYISGSPFVLQQIYSLTAQQYSLVFAVNGLGIVLLGQANAMMVGRIANEHTLLAIGLATGSVGGIGVLLCTVIGLPLALLLTCLFIVVSMLGLVMANATSLALARHGSTAGAASSLAGLLQFLIGGLAASALGLADDRSAATMGAVLCLCAVAALAIFILLRGHPTRPTLCSSKTRKPPAGPITAPESGRLGLPPPTTTPTALAPHESVCPNNVEAGPARARRLKPRIELVF